jgi:hypothetical protein
VIAKATATRAKGTFLQAKYYRLVKRMPKQKALGAVAHRLLVISYHLLSRGVPYAELGSAPLDPQQVDRHRRRLMSLTSKSCWGVVLMYGGKDTSKERYKSFLIVAFAKADDVNRWHKIPVSKRVSPLRTKSYLKELKNAPVENLRDRSF